MAETKRVKTPQDFMGELLVVVVASVQLALCRVCSANAISNSGFPDGWCFCCTCRRYSAVKVFGVDIMFYRPLPRRRQPQLSASSFWYKIRMRWYVLYPIAETQMFYTSPSRSSRVVWLPPTRASGMLSVAPIRKKALFHFGEVTLPT
jgi:hypothetical protein